MNKFHYIALIALFSASVAQAQSSCAVLPFKAGAGFTGAQADAMTRKFRTELEKTGEFSVLSEKITKERIASQLSNRPAAVTPYYLIAGRVLKVDYIVIGTVEAAEDALWLNTDLCDIRNKQIRKRVKVYYKGDSGTFLRMAPASNIKQLLSDELPDDRLKKTASNNTEPKNTRITASDDAKSWDGGMLESLHGYVHGNIQAGLRVSYYKLTQTEKESFLGSINKLKEEQDFMPDIFARVKIMEPFWITLGYNKIKAKTWTEAEPDSELEGYTDGTIELSGPSILLHVHTQRKNDIQWFGEIGFGLYGASFIHDPAWRDARGDINSHIMVFEDTVGVIINGGCDLFLSENLSMTAYAGYTRVTSDMTYYLYGNERDSRTFPLSNIALGMGIQYHF